MALLFADGFEHYGVTPIATVRENMAAGEYAVASSTGNPSGSQARTGSRSFAASQTGGLRKQLFSTSNEVGVAFGFYLPLLPSGLSGKCGFSFTDLNNNYIIAVGVSVSGAVEVHRGQASSSDLSTLIGATDNGLISTQAWNHIEVRLLQDNVVGEVEVRVNGVQELVLTNLDLGTVRPGFWYTNFNGTIGQSNRFYDDLILWDNTGDVNNTFFGPARVTFIGLEGDEPGNQWSVVGAASGAASLTETMPNGDTSYVSAATVGAISEFGIAELPPEAEAIAGLYIPAMGKLATAGIGNAQVSIVSDGEVESGPDTPLTAAYTYRGKVFEKDPATGQLWTKSGVEAARIRIEKTA